MSETAVVQPQLGLGHKIDQLYELRQRKKDLEKEIDALEEEMEELEASIMAHMDTEGTTLTRGGRASVSILESEVPSVEDWDAVHEFVKKHDALYLLERRIALGAWRELKDAGELMPGTTPVIKRKLSVRKV